jgi:RNA polymerase sigma-70 factor (ECF subfamily)
MAAKRDDAQGRDAVDGADAFLMEMVELARSGDRTAFHRLVDRFQPEIYRMIYYRTRSEMDAEDITQDVMLQAFRHIKRLKSAQVFKSWLYRIAVNRVRDYYRKKKFRSLFPFISIDDDNAPDPEELSAAPEVEDGISRKEFWHQVQGMLTDLSRMEKEVFLLRFFDELAIHEISTALQKTESTIKTHLYRALRKVKAAAGDMDGLWEGK